MDKIFTAEDAYFLPGAHDLSPAEAGVALHWRDKATGLHKFDGTNMPEEINRQLKAVAHISFGRWVADCPTGCHSAAYVSSEDPRMFCTHCGNGWFQVIFPKEKERKRIEELLLRRPLPENRIWYPYETVAVIEDENRRHGIDAS